MEIKKDYAFADLLRGAEEIAAYTGENSRQVNYKLARGIYPSWKVGSRYHSTKPIIRAVLLGEKGLRDG